MTKWTIPVSVEVHCEIDVEASTFEKAKALALDYAEEEWDRGDANGWEIPPGTVGTECMVFSEND